MVLVSADALQEQEPYDPLNLENENVIPSVDTSVPEVSLKRPYHIRMICIKIRSNGY